MKSNAVTVRRPIPLARSIRWDPVSASPRAATLAEPLVFLTQGLLREVARHLESAPDQELLGFLLGELFECPNSGQRYVVLFGASRTGYAIPEEEPVQIPEEQWLGAQLESRRRRVPLAGWYHGAPFVGAEPARLDVQSHRQRFTEPWQCGVVMTTSAAAGQAGANRTGGVFRVRGADAAYIPFHELLDDEAFLEGGRRRSALTWSTYRTSELVEHEPAPVAPRRGSSSPAGAAPSVGASRNTAILPVVIPSPSRTGEMPAVPPPERHRFRIGMLSVGLLALITVGLLMFVRSQGDILAPFRRPTLSPAPSNPAPARAAVAPAAIDSLAARAGDSATSLAATSGAADTSATGLRDSAPLAAAATPVSPAAPAAPSATPAALRFDALADSLETTIRNFGVRQSDFTAKRIDCNALAAGYRAADDAFIALASQYRQVRDALDSARDTRYQSLGSRMETVNEDFDASRCPRP